jgi:Protein of unknown function (DUF2723)
VRLTAADVACACAVGLLTLGLYTATLQPDFGGPEDTPKFQFLGLVLGTAHPPGYPLYSWLSHLFVTTVRIGTVAYRANLFSALMAALACAVTFLLARQIDAGRWASVGAALALGAGASFWRSAVFAEVYSLAAVIVAATVSFLLAWDGRSRATLLLAATGVFALGLGNHLTIVGLIPACLVYVAVRNRRVLRPRVVAAAIALLALGVSQYGLILIRTHQEAPYLESRASSLRELIGVVTAERYAGQRFAFSPWVLLTDHLPAIASVIGHELRLPGVLLIIAGLLFAIRQRSSGVGLLAGAAAGLLFMVLNLEGDLNGFITPVMVLLWPIAALGVTAVARTLRAHAPIRVVVPAATLALAVISPIANVTANYLDADQSAHTGAARFLRTLFRELPDEAGVVADNYYDDMAIQYMTLTREGGPPRGIRRIGFDTGAVRAARNAGRMDGSVRRVFAFAGGALFFGTDGLRFERTDIPGPTLDDWLDVLPRGTIVVAATAYIPAPIDLARLERSHARPAGRPRTYEAFALRTGTTDAAWSGGDERASLVVESPALRSAPQFHGRLTVSADAAGARITLSDATLAAVDAGLAVAAFAPDGSLIRSEIFERDEPVRIPFQEAVYELTGEVPCVPLTAGGWKDVSPALTTGSWIAAVPSIGSVAIETSVPSSSDGLHARSTQLMGDGITGTRITTSPDGDQIVTTEMTRASESRAVFRLTLDGPIAHTRARVRPGGVSQAITVCSHHPARPLFRPGSSSGVLRTDFESEAYYGPGWGDPERNQAGSFRRADARSTLLLPLERGFSYHVALDLSSEDEVTVAAALNGDPVGGCDVRGHAGCELTLPQRAVRGAVSALTIVQTATGHESRRLMFRGARIRRERETTPPPQ